MVWLVLKFAGAFWVLWGLFVFLLVSTLKEIDPTSVHYRLAKFCTFNQGRKLREVKDSCSYRARLLWLPLILPLMVVAHLVYIVVRLGVFLGRVVGDWLIRPFVMGDMPTRQQEMGMAHNYRSVTYLQRAFIDPLSESGRTNYERFMVLSPLAYACIVGVLFSLVRTMMQSATRVEFWLSMVFLTIVGLIGAFIFYAKVLDEPVRERYQELRGKLCRPLSIKQSFGSPNAE